MKIALKCQKSTLIHDIITRLTFSKTLKTQLKQANKGIKWRPKDYFHSTSVCCISINLIDEVRFKPVL